VTPRHFVLASGDVVVSYAAPASPPAVLVGADDTVATINLLVERDVGDGDTLKLLEPPLNFSRVDRWWEIPVHWPFRGSRADWKE
jgi:hypothetical protein